MPVNTHYVDIRGRLQNATALDPTLVATIASSTAFIDAVVVNGKELDLRKLSASELTTLKAALKSSTTDMIDFPTFTQTGPTGGTANGTMTNVAVDQALGVTETWTITSTSSTTFTVSGSVSGAQAGVTLSAATVGTTVNYANTIVSFTLTQGSVAFNTTAATVFTIVVTGN